VEHGFEGLTKVPQIQSFVRALLVDGDTLYAGGNFSTVGGIT
jgi:hypothetical protein